mmetsp:Transcript_19299/g.35701  ORF Transcript_19299/g.35701 Transcript_19299/m.35701 type:complete len:202 (-) Transcript_19299:549-1154(-)
MTLGAYARQGKLNLSINSTRSDQSRVECFDTVCSHDYLYVSSVIESIQLVQQFKHRSLDLLRSARIRVVTLHTDSIDFINKDNGRRVVFSDFKHLTYELGSIAKVLLNELRAYHPEKSCRGLVCNCFNQKCFSCSGGPVQDYPLGWFNSNVFVQFRVRERQFDRFLDLLYLFFKTTNVGISFHRGLINLHCCDKRISVITQ